MRRHEVDNRNSHFAQLPCDAQMKVGGIGEDGKIGLFLTRGLKQPPVFAIDTGQVFDHFDQANNTQLFGINHGSNPRCKHPGLGATEEIEIGASLAKRGNQAGRVKIATRLSRRDQNLPRHSTPAYRAIIQVLMTESLTVRDFAERFRKEMVPLSGKIKFYSAGLRLNEEDEKELIYDPVSSLPPMVRELLPEISIVLVPHLEGVDGSTVVMEAPKTDVEDRIWQNEFQEDGNVVLTFAVQGCDSGDYHYRFFRTIAAKVAERAEPKFWAGFEEILRDELKRRVHGDVDEDSWRAKDELMSKSGTPWRDSKQFQAYARIATSDTLTLYLHGLCCDIDVEPGPRQIQSRELRKRLVWLNEKVGAPEGYAIFPEQKKPLAG